MFETVVVGADNSATTTAVIVGGRPGEAGRGRTAPCVTAYGSSSSASPDHLPAEFRFEAIHPADLLLQSLSKVVEERGLTPVVHPATGSAVDAMVRVAAEVQADLIVVGNKGMKGRAGCSAWCRLGDGRPPCSVLIVDTRGLPDRAVSAGAMVPTAPTIAVVPAARRRDGRHAPPGTVTTPASRPGRRARPSPCWPPPGPPPTTPSSWAPGSAWSSSRLGLAGAVTFWTTGLAGWATVARGTAGGAPGPLLDAACGAALAGSLVHFTLWPWPSRRWQPGPDRGRGCRPADYLPTTPSCGAGPGRPALSVLVEIPDPGSANRRCWGRRRCPPCDGRPGTISTGSAARRWPRPGGTVPWPRQPRGARLRGAAVRVIAVALVFLLSFPDWFLAERGLAPIRAACGRWRRPRAKTGWPVATRRSGADRVPERPAAWSGSASPSHAAPGCRDEPESMSGSGSRSSGPAPSGACPPGGAAAGRGLGLALRTRRCRRVWSILPRLLTGPVVESSPVAARRRSPPPPPPPPPGKQPWPRGRGRLRWPNGRRSARTPSTPPCRALLVVEAAAPAVIIVGHRGGRCAVAQG